MKKRQEGSAGKKALVWKVVVALVILALVGAGVYFFMKSPSRAERLRRKGMLFLVAGKNAEAVECLRKALEANPDHIEAREGLVRALTAQKRFSEAFEELTRLKAKGFGEADAALLRAAILRRRARHRIESAGEQMNATLMADIVKHEMGPAVTLCRKYVDGVKGKEKAYTFLGELLSGSGRMLSACRIFLLDEADAALAANNPDLYAAKRKEAQGVLVALNAVRREAVEAYMKAVQSGSDAVAARLALARIYLGSYVPRCRWAKAVLAPIFAKHPHHVEAWVIMASTESLLGDDKAALAGLMNVPKASRKSRRVALAEARALAGLERWPEVDAVLARAEGIRGGDPMAAFLQGKALLRMGKPAKAVNLLQNIFTNRKVRWAEARCELAEALLQAGNREQAVPAFRQVLDDAAATRISNQQMYQRVREAKYKACLALAREVRKVSSSSAAKYARSAVMVFPERAEGIAVVRDVYASSGKEAPGELDDLVLLHISALDAAKGHDAALQAYEEELKRPGAPVKRVRWLMARLHVRNAAYREAIAAYEGLWKDYPDDPRFGSELARLQIIVGRHEDALAVYEKLQAAYPKAPAVVAGRLLALLAANKTDAACKVLQEYGRAYGGDLAQKLLMRLHLREGRTADAVVLARALVKGSPDDARAYSTLGELLCKEGNLPEARTALAKAIELEPNTMAAYVLGLVDLMEGKNQEAVLLFRGAMVRFPKWMTARMYLAVALQAQGKAGEAVTVLQEAVKGAPAMSASWDFPRWILAVALASRGDLAGAEKVNGEMGESVAGVRSDREAFLAALAGMGKDTRARGAGSGNRLLILSYAGLIGPARAALGEVEKVLPKEPLPRCWYGRAFEKEGKFAEAIEQYGKVVKGYPECVSARMALAQCQVKAGDAVSGIATMERVVPLVSGEEAARVHTWLGGVCETHGRVDAAMGHYEASLKLRPRDALALNNLAWLLATRKKDVRAALPLAERAAVLSRFEPRILDTLGWIYHLDGQTDNAVKMLEGAKKRLGNNPTVRYHLGMTYLKQGQREKAKAELKDALSLSDDFDGADEARKALNAL